MVSDHSPESRIFSLSVQNTQFYYFNNATSVNSLSAVVSLDGFYLSCSGPNGLPLSPQKADFSMSCITTMDYCNFHKFPWGDLENA